MKRPIFTVLLILFASTAYAAGPELVWVGGSMRFTDESRPGYIADTMISFGQIDSIYLFTEPALTVKDSKAGANLVIGGRSPVLSGQAVAGYSVFFDYTADNNHKRVGAGAELLHPYFSGHLNIYLPISDDSHGEEALPGADLTLGIPVPNASFITFWPGLYYYNGNDRSDMQGFSLALEIKPMEVFSMSFGGRNDAIQSGRDESELYGKIEITIPMRRLGKDIFKMSRGQYPLDMNSQMDNRVVRERFITYEKKRQ